jgi:hypothetical protein
VEEAVVVAQVRGWWPKPGGGHGYRRRVKMPFIAGRVAQVVEHLPSKCEAPSSNPVLTPKKHGICSGD